MTSTPADLIRAHIADYFTCDAPVLDQLDDECVTITFRHESDPYKIHVVAEEYADALDAAVAEDNGDGVDFPTIAEQHSI